MTNRTPKPPKANILIVDDTGPNLSLLSTMLTLNGFAVYESVDGPSALLSVQNNLPDLILLDVRMPGMDGFEVCRQLKASEATCQIPIIFVSALDEQTDKVQGFAAGGVDYITKPFQVKEVLARVETHLTTRNLQKQLEAQNAQLQQEIAVRMRFQAELQVANEGLEKRVQVRTADLLVANQALKTELAERQRAEQALLDSQRFNQSIIAATPGLVYIFDLEKRGLTYINRNLGEMLGYSPSEVAAMQDRLLPNLLHPDDAHPFTGIYERWKSARDADVMIYEYRMKTRSGAWRWFQGRETIFRRQEGGAVAQVIGTATEITERKQAEAERERLLGQVREQAQQVREIIRTVPEGVLLLDAQGQVALANPMAESHLRLLAGVQIGDTLAHLADRSLTELLTSPPKGLWHEVKQDLRIFEVASRPLLADGLEPQRWVVVIREVTREREVQYHSHQQERLAAVGQLAAGIAHDFNNILAVILLYAEMALGTPDLDPKLRERLHTISQQAKRASDLIQQILDFSRRAVLERRTMDLLPFLKEQVKLLERTLPESIQIHLGYRSGEFMVDADPTRMQQAIMNLVVNARDAMPEGGELNIAVSRPSSPEDVHCVTCGPVTSGDWIQIAFSDTGSGIPPDVLAHIFEPFFTTKAPGEGTGLGLAQVYGIVKQHEGHVDVISTLGKGSTFNIFLPALPLDLSQSRDLESAPFMRGQGQTILVVEDEKATRQALIDGLTLLNFRVLATADGRQALELLSQQSKEIDLILSDVVMPEMGGIAMLRAIRAQGLQTPVVFLTGHPMQDELEKLRSEGLSAWLFKPPRLTQLAKTIVQVLKDS